MLRPTSLFLRGLRVPAWALLERAFQPRIIRVCALFYPTETSKNIGQGGKNARASLQRIFEATVQVYTIIPVWCAITATPTRRRRASVVLKALSRL